MKTIKLLLPAFLFFFLACNSVDKKVDEYYQLEADYVKTTMNAANDNNLTQSELDEISSKYEALCILFNEIYYMEDTAKSNEIINKIENMQEAEEYTEKKLDDFMYNDKISDQVYDTWDELTDSIFSEVD